MWGQPLPEKIGSAPLDWESLGFDYIPTKSHMRFVCLACLAGHLHLFLTGLEGWTLGRGS